MESLKFYNELLEYASTHRTELESTELHIILPNKSLKITGIGVYKDNLVLQFNRKYKQINLFKALSLFRKYIKNDKLRDSNLLVYSYPFSYEIRGIYYQNNLIGVLCS